MAPIVFTSRPLTEAVRDLVFIHRFLPSCDHGPFLEVSDSALRILEYSQEELRTLRGISPLYHFCKKIKDDKGYWEQVDVYIQKYSKADISHGICPDCMIQHYPEER